MQHQNTFVRFQQHGCQALPQAVCPPSVHTVPVATDKTGTEAIADEITFQKSIRKPGGLAS